MSKSTQCVSGNVGIQDEWSVFTVLALNQHPTWATTSHSVCVLPGEPEPCGSPGRNWNWLSSFSYTVSGSWSGLNQSELLFTSSCSRTGTRTQATKDESSHDALTPHTRVHKQMTTEAGYIASLWPAAFQPSSRWEDCHCTQPTPH